MTTRALVLAGGGLAGIAWELGLLLGLRDEGIDLLDSTDLVIGTSAGSAVAAQILSGESLDASYDRQLRPTSTEIAVDIDAAALFAAMNEVAAGARDERERLRGMGTLALAAQTVPEATRRAVIAARLPNHDWPARRLLITAVSVDGEFTVFDASSGVDLVDAVAASCAVPGVWPPVTIDGRRYMDGGVRSGTNADLARGADAVCAINPAIPGLADSLDEELRSAGVERHVTIRADEAALRAFGVNPLDPATREPSARAGRVLGRTEARRLASIWGD